MRAMLTALAVTAWFAGNGLLWFIRPSDVLWLLGSAILGIVFFGGFLWYLIARDDPVSGPSVSTGSRRAEYRQHAGECQRE